MRLIQKVAFGALGVGLLTLGNSQVEEAKLEANIDESCKEADGSDPVSGAKLGLITPFREGVAFDDVAYKLRLVKEGGVFRSAAFDLNERVQFVCAADFDHDGWEDIVGAGSIGGGTSTDANNFIAFYKNRTYENQAATPPDWDSDTYITVPKFVKLTIAGKIQYIEYGGGPTATRAVSNHPAGGASNGGSGSIACGDFNNDTHPDFIYIRQNGDNGGAIIRAHIFLGKGDGMFNAPYQFVSNVSQLNNIRWSGSNFAVVKWDDDPYPDLVWGSDNGNGGKIQIFLNDGDPSQANVADKQPKMIPNIVISHRLGMGTRGPLGMSVGDFNRDGKLDIVAAATSARLIKFYPGPFVNAPNGTYDPPFQAFDLGSPGTGKPAYRGGATLALKADFTLDGLDDIVIANDDFNFDGGVAGGTSFIWRNDGTTTPFKKYHQQLTTRNSPPTNYADYDTGTVVQLDNDPDGTPDLIIADGNNAGSAQILVNRTISTYVQCGSVSSDLIDLEELATEELTITSVRLVPVSQLNGGTITWDVSNDGGSSWHPAQACTDNVDEFCVAFGSSVGNKIRWRANMCANAARTQSPAITEVALNYTYVTAENHFRAGPIASEGIIYVGTFKEPGAAGEFFALNDETGAVAWNASEKLDARAPATRRIYSATSDNQRLELVAANADTEEMRLLLQVADTATATSILSWIRTARFGLITPAHLGAIENSTPAILSPPNKPYWYGFGATSSEDRESINEFNTQQADRPHLAFVGSRDGMLHAFRTDVGNVTAATNGEEAWAFVPLVTAGNFRNDKLNNTPSSYPDGSPTLADVRLGGAWRTVLIAGASNGGRYVYALDVTDSDTAGPTPLWSFQDPNMGRTYSKPTVVRLKRNDEEKWLAIFASGPGLTTDVGDTLYAVDMATGQLEWRFDIGDTDCYISSDITAVETDDDGEDGDPEKDGYIDRLLFADSKGRIWKVDPNSGTGGAQIGSIGAVTIVGLDHQALFSTKLTSGALGDERIISGTVAAAEDLTGRLALFFGTGGSDDSSNTVTNEFYAVYADNGTIRSKITTDIGVKFYGGVVYNDGQLIFSTGQDLSGVGLCAPTAGEIVAVDANTFAEQFSIPVSSKIVAPIYASSGAFYTSTLKGEIVASAYLGAQGAPETGGTGGGTTGGGGTGGGEGQTGTGAGAVRDAFRIMGWKEVR